MTGWMSTDTEHPLPPPTPGPTLFPRIPLPLSLSHFLYVLKWDGRAWADREKIALHFELGGGELQIPVFVESEAARWRKRRRGARVCAVLVRAEEEHWWGRRWR